MKRLYKLMRWGNVLLILVTFLAYLSPFINPESFSWINIVGTAYPWLLLANVIFVVLWLVLKNRYALFSIACILLGWNHLTGFIGVNVSSGNLTEKTFRVVTFNTSGLKFLAAKDTLKHLQNIKDFVNTLHQEGNIDILCLQEVGAHKAQLAVKKLGFKYQHRIPYKGTSILSQHPIVKTGDITFTTRTNSCVWADIKVKGKTVRVYNTHFKSNQVSTTAERILTEGEIQEKETWSDIKGVFGKFRYTSVIRAQQARKVKAHMEQSPHPVVLCGDFNETAQSYIYNMLSENLLDSFRQKGFGLGTTYSGSIPALRIDFILSDPRIRILDCQIFKEAFSDHYPVYTAFEF